MVNLRGVCDPMPWYLDECRVTNRLGVSQEESDCQPVDSRRKRSTALVDVLDERSIPIMFHCKQGADRTGMASAIYLLLHTDTPLTQASDNLGCAIGHIPLGKTSSLDRFFNLYLNGCKTMDLSIPLRLPPLDHGRVLSSSMPLFHRADRATDLLAVRGANRRANPVPQHIGPDVDVTARLVRWYPCVLLTAG